MTTNDKEIDGNPHRPEGLRRNGTVFVVAPPRNVGALPRRRLLESGAVPPQRWYRYLRYRPLVACNEDMRINHVTHNISRDNVEAARRFYSQSLGLEEVPAILDPTGKRLIWYRLGSHLLHLSIRDQADARSTRHIAVVINDFEECLSRLEEDDVPCDRWDAGSLWRVLPNGTRSVFCYDPDGNRIELLDGE